MATIAGLWDPKREAESGAVYYGESVLGDGSFQNGERVTSSEHLRGTRNSENKKTGRGLLKMLRDLKPRQNGTHLLPLASRDPCPFRPSPTPRPPPPPSPHGLFKRKQWWGCGCLDCSWGPQLHCLY